MLVILYIFFATSLINLCFHLGFFSFAFHRQEKLEKQEPLPVSIIICAKNEARNLKRLLPAILAQDHPEFEVVVINDASIDNTLEVIEDFHKDDERVKVVNVRNNEAFWASKKYALTLGIKKAENPYLLFTDADCQPQSSQWITHMTTAFRQNKSITLGYGGYLYEKGSWLNKVIRFETLVTAIQYFSYAKWGTPYMGVGRNLAYTSRKFYEQNGFATHLQLRSGDDDLFVNRAATAENTAISTDPDAFTRSIPKKSFRAWFTQKRRHVSVAGHYKSGHILLLGLFYGTQFLFWCFLVILLCSAYWKIALAILSIRLLVQGVLFLKAGKKLKETDLIWLFPFLELFLVCVQLGIFISNIISKPTHWK